MKRLLVTLLILSATPAAADDDLARRIEAITAAPDYRHARWGILVVDAKTGRTVYSRNADQFATPASVTKLFTCAAAMIALGPDSTTTTPVYRTGILSKAGVLTGNLVLVAAGDLTFGGRTKADGTVAFADNDHTYANSGLSEATLTDTDPLAGLKALAKQVAAAGIKEVAGEVLIDDRLFDKTRGSGSGPDSITPILVNDNVIDVVVSPVVTAGERALVAVKPDTAVLKADIEVVTAPTDTPTAISLYPAGPTTFAVRGRIAAGAKPVVRIYAVDDPAFFARGLFVEELRRAGVRVVASVTQYPTTPLPEKTAYTAETKVAEFVSPPFREAVKVTLKVSHNLYASTLPLLVAAKAGKRAPADGFRTHRRIYADLGIGSDGMSFGGGAGGNPADLATPRATVDLLTAMAKRPEWPAYKAALPVLGVDGTLAASVPPDSPARGKVFGKTGTLVWSDLLNGRNTLRSKALAGVMTTARGTDLTFALFVNDVPLPAGVPTSREGKQLGKLCEVIYRHGP